MLIPDEQSIEIKEVSDLVTVVDTPDTPENFAIATRGFRHGREGMIAERDKGTQHRYATYPTMSNFPDPNKPVTIVGGYPLYDKDGNVEWDIIAGVDATNMMHLWVYDGGWKELTAVLTAVVNVIAGGNGIYTCTIKDAYKQSFAYTIGVNELVGYIGVKNSSLAGCKTAVVIASNTATSVVSTGTPLGPDGGEWTAEDTITFYASTAIREFNMDNGTSPHLRWLATEAQRKVTLAYGNSATPIATRNPIRIMRRGQRKYFFTGASTALMTMPAASTELFYCEKGGGLETGYAELDLYNNDEGTRSMEICEWLYITAKGTKVPYVTNPNVYTQYYITIQYGHQESDPVGRWGVGYNQVSDIHNLFKFYINPAFMPKDVTGFNLYRSRKVVDPTLPEATQIQLRTSSLEDFTLAKFIDITKYDSAVSWALTPLTGLSAFSATYSMLGQYTNSFLDEDESDDNLLSVLQHSPDFTRTRLRSRFIARAGREQGAIVAADKDDNEVLFSCINGELVHQEDNFVDRSSDNQGNTQKAFLSGHGPMLGLGMLQMNLLVFRPTEIEVHDVQTGHHDSVPADVCSKDSILQVDAPKGITWAGTSGLYFLGDDGGGQQLLNPRWINFYNGDLKIPGTDTSYVTQAAREAILTGFDPFYNDLWYQILCNKAGGGTEYLQFRYNLEQKRWWCVRKLNIGSGPDKARFFSPRMDKTLAIGYASGILKYPVQTGNLQYEDDVTYAGTSANKGIESDITIELGSLYSIIKKNVLTRFKLDHVGTSASGTGGFSVEMFANNETSSLFSTKTVPIDSRAKVRTIKRRGRLESIRMRLYIASGAPLYDIRRLDLSTIVVSFVKRNMIGRR